jgi:flavin-dependent dehydrogenase
MPEGGFAPSGEVLELDFGGVRNGYRWIFRKASQLSIGACTTGADCHNLRERLKEYIETHRILRTCKVVSTVAHPIPFFSGQRRLQDGRVLLTGDAAGLSDPLTGEGILHAVRSALIAACCVEEFLLGRSPLEVYTERVSREILLDLGYAAKFAEAFYRWPWASYLTGTASKTVSSALMKVLLGRGTYKEAYRGFEGVFLGRLSRLLAHYRPGKTDLRAPLKAAP